MKNKLTIAIAVLTVSAVATLAQAQNALAPMAAAQPTIIITAPAAAQPSKVAAEPAVSATASKEEKARTAKREFQKLLNERQQLSQRLTQLDTQALNAVKNDQRPVGAYAEQISVQDKLDLISLRLEMLAMRYDFNIPPVNGDTSENGDDSQQASEMRIDEFSRGTQRTLGKLRQQTLKMLSSLDVEGFVASRSKMGPNE